MVAALPVVVLPPTAAALPAEGAAVPECAVERIDGSPRTLPDHARSTLVLYEDRDAGAQNRHLKPLLDVADREQNAGKLAVVGVADLSAYDFWPAKRFVLADIRKRQAKDKAVIWLDWKGTVRERWGLTRGRSGVLLLDPAGKVRFAVEGPLDKAQLDRLTALLLALGCDLK